MGSMVVTGDKKVSAKLRAMGDRAEHVNPRAWQGVGRMLSGKVKRQFLTNGAYFGTPWRRLTPAYAKQKIRMGGSPSRILRLTGEMERGFTGRPMDIEQYTGNSARFGSSNQKAVWHHYGTFRNGKRVNPPRKIMVVNRDVRRETKNIMRRYIMRGET